MAYAASVDRDVIAWASDLAAKVSCALEGKLTGAYLHGSAALGGFVPGRSDVDLLFVVDGPLNRAARVDVAAVITRFEGCPGSGIEASVLTRDQALLPELGAFEVHVCTGPDAKVVDGRGHTGDDDLVLHAVVVRAAGLALLGPPPVALFGEVEREVVLARMAEELDWGLANASAAYTVLNACRALLWAEEGCVISKVAAGEWVLSRLPRWPEVIQAALADQASHNAADRKPAAAEREFVEAVQRQVGL